MLSKNDIKFIRSLAQSKQRNKAKCFVAEGSKIINELLESGMRHRKIFTLSSSKIEADDEVYEIKERELRQISFLVNPSDALAVMQMPDYTSLEIKTNQNLILACDCIQDPGNFGTILRIADWFGVSQILCSKDTVDVFNPKVVQSSMASIARVAVRYEDLSTQIKSLIPDFKVVSASLNGQDLYQTELPSKTILILGNESRGVNSALQEASDLKVKIPSNGKAESLNVAVSAGILCAEFRRRH